MDLISQMVKEALIGMKITGCENFYKNKGKLPEHCKYYLEQVIHNAK